MTIKLHFIYVLRDENGNVFYVGKTSTPEKRLKRHLSHVRYGSTYPVHNKLRKVISIKGNFEGIYEIIESNIKDESIDEREMFFIKFYKECGCNLKNLTDGGEGGKGFTPEINKRGALKRTGRKRTDETRKRISKSKTGVKFSNGHKNALRIAWKDRTPFSTEHYKKLSEITRGKINIKNFVLMSSDGKIHITHNGLTDFCRTNNLSCQNLIHTKPGGKRKHHKGWKILSEIENSLDL